MSLKTLFKSSEFVQYPRVFITSFLPDKRMGNFGWSLLPCVCSSSHLLRKRTKTKSTVEVFSSSLRGMPKTDHMITSRNGRKSCSERRRRVGEKEMILCIISSPFCFYSLSFCFAVWVAGTVA